MCTHVQLNEYNMSYNNYTMKIFDKLSISYRENDQHILVNIVCNYVTVKGAT